MNNLKVSSNEWKKIWIKFQRFCNFTEYHRTLWLSLTHTLSFSLVLAHSVFVFCVCMPQHDTVNLVSIVVFTPLALILINFPCSESIETVFSSLLWIKKRRSRLDVERFSFFLAIYLRMLIKWRSLILLSETSKNNVCSLFYGVARCVLRTDWNFIQQFKYRILYLLLYLTRQFLFFFFKLLCKMHSKAYTIYGQDSFTLMFHDFWQESRELSRELLTDRCHTHSKNFIFRKHEHSCL